MSLSRLNPLVITQTRKVIDKHLECDKALPLPSSLSPNIKPQFDRMIPPPNVLAPVFLNPLCELPTVFKDGNISVKRNLHLCLVW